MIHVLTVHFHNSDWIELQYNYLRRFMSEPFRVWGGVQGIEEEHYRFFDEAIPMTGAHAGKLNHLARLVADTSDRDDLMMFMDGDAFPVADPIPPVRALLKDSALAAVHRSENRGDLQPHPCFCAVPVRNWIDIRGDWSGGYDYLPRRSDVGANLLYILEATGTPWAPIHRSNTRDDHPLFFGVYGGFLYHHGAGFRKEKVCRADSERNGATTQEEQWKNIFELMESNAALSEEVYENIKADRDFFLRYM